MEKQTLKETLLQAEKLILSGQIRQAAELIHKKDLVASTRAEELLLARVFRRIGLPEQALRILTPTIRPKAALLKPATDEEKAEYAICLLRVGSLREAREMLDDVDARNVPEVLLYRAAFYFPDWNYAATIPLLREFLKTAPPENHTTRLGKINLAAALVHENQLGAEDLLRELIEETGRHHEYLLLGNVLEISAQLALKKHDFDGATNFLKKGEEILSGVKVLDYLWLVKWKNITKALRDKSLEPLQEVLAEALLKRHWETIREVDYFSLQIRFDKDVFNRLYFGTKSPYYRERVRKLNPEGSLPETIAVGAGWTVSEHVPTNAIDIFSMGEGDLAPGTVQNAFLVHLLSDWYKGYRTGEMHSILFPGDYYNPDTSLNRVHKTISRFRKALLEIPIAHIDIDNYIYRLALKGEGQIVLPQTMPAPDPLKIKLFLMENRSKEKYFSSDDVQHFLNISKSNANNLIQQWQEQKLVDVHLDQRPRLYVKISDTTK